ncbi:IS4 family transposase, partial [Shewanella frigidimarina]
FQANSIKHRAVLSVVRLGKEVRRRPKYTLKASIIYWALNEYIKLVHTAGRPKL